MLIFVFVDINSKPSSRLLRLIIKQTTILEMLSMRKTGTTILIFLMGINFTWAQLGFLRDDNVPVFKNGNPLSNAWAGGLNYIQISDFDFDFDGDMDLFVFDRSKENIRVFEHVINGGVSSYRIKHDVQSLFPNDIRYRATMIDYDNDGRKDLFTYGIGGLKVYRNVGDALNGLQWELFQDLVYSQYPNNYSNLYISSSDIPAIVDVDGDGDIDVLTYHQGGSHVEYHQNQSMDLYGIPDSLIFELKNECWGKFSEDVNTNAITLNDPNVPCVGGSIPNPERLIEEAKSGAHSGSTLLAIDMDNSGVLDLIIGDASFTNLNLLINGGTAVNTDSPMISVEPNFPSNTTPVNVQLFPAAFYVDVDFDGVKDLIVAPNAKNISFNEKSVLFYKNLGSNTLPNFIYITNNFLQSDMIEHGTGSIPVFMDYNEDGLTDMMVANFHRYKPILDKESIVAYYQNTGTANAPEYTFVDEDVFNLAQEAYGLRSVPAFGDLDGDGDEDMLVGIENGTLVYYPNNSSGSGANFGAPQLNYTDNNGTIINSNGFAHPQLYDLNKDGLLDLIIGKRSGEIMYYQNIGTINSPSFQLVTDQLGNVDVSTTTPDGYAAPHFFELNGATQLFVGSVDGQIIYFDSIDGHIGSGDSFHLVSTSFLGLNFEGYSSFAVRDIDGDGNFNMMVGQELGGIGHFEVDPNSSIGITETEFTPTVAIYPNPAESYFVISQDNAENLEYRLFSIEGKEILNGQTKGMKTKVEFDQLSSGTYILHFTSGSNSFSKRLIIK